MAVNAKDFVTSSKGEAMKSYSAYDGSDRLEYFYETFADAQDGDPCIVTQYTYSGTSTRIVKTKEYVGTWVSATMDI